MVAALRVVQLAEQLSIECNDATQAFPAFEQSRLADQLRRAAASIALNLAEGAARSSLKDRLRFLDTARGSLKEVETALRISVGSRYISRERYEALEKLRDEIARMTFGLIRSVKRRLEQSDFRRAG